MDQQPVELSSLLLFSIYSIHYKVYKLHTYKLGIRSSHSISQAIVYLSTLYTYSYVFQSTFTLVSQQQVQSQKASQRYIGSISFFYFQRKERILLQCQGTRHTIPIRLYMYLYILYIPIYVPQFSSKWIEIVRKPRSICLYVQTTAAPSRSI